MEDKIMISIIHPSRGRPEQAIKTFGHWLDNSEDNFEYILSLDQDEPTNSIIGSSQYVTLFNSRYDDIKIVTNKNRSAIDAINNGAKIATGDILLQIADDFQCPIHWDEQIRLATEGKTDWILKTPDGIQNWIITLPIMDRAYYNQFGYIYHPDYQHMFCDTEMSCVADLTGRRITANIPFKHNHYSVGGAVKDAISERADKTWEQGEKLFLSRYRQNFGLIDMPGRIQDQGMLNWIKSKGI